MTHDYSSIKSLRHCVGERYRHISHSDVTHHLAPAGYGKYLIIKKERVC